MTGDTTDGCLDRARALAERVVEHLGPDAPPLVIEKVLYYHGFDQDPWEMIFSNEPSDDVRVVVRIDQAGTPRIGAHLVLSAPRHQSVAAFATHIQDHVLEYTRGEPLPPCPGHAHPLDPKVHDGVASWVCPKDPAHHVEPILPTDAER